MNIKPSLKSANKSILDYYMPMTGKDYYSTQPLNIESGNFNWVYNSKPIY